ncbi:MAG: UDP-3-O-(3-hydroxymyristoyl)glucosamine N-acyltransferase [Balneola sp.]|nr:UDP-3-O-(3-hydroxymyristoyl)glucosamine N-acyltransferase [Balneola sp.]
MAYKQPFFLDELLEVMTAAYSREGLADNHQLHIVASIEDKTYGPSKKAITWCHPSADNKQQIVEKTKATVVVCDMRIVLSSKMKSTKTLIKVEDPKLAFTRMIRSITVKTNETGVHPSCVVHPEAEIDATASIGPNCTIGKCVIGAKTNIHGNCHLYDGVVIGEEAVIEAGVVLGAEGFGLAKTSDGVWERFPHNGGVRISNRVEVGAGSTIDRGAIQDTVIGEGTKISKAVHISHNVQIGKHCLITGAVSIAGSTTIGDHVWISPGATILNKLSIGDHAFVALGATVTQTIPDRYQAIGRRIIPKM